MSKKVLAEMEFHEKNMSEWCREFRQWKILFEKNMISFARNARINKSRWKNGSGNDSKTPLKSCKSPNFSTGARRHFCAAFSGNIFPTVL
jgi:hypothetical protein